MKYLAYFLSFFLPVSFILGQFGRLQFGAIGVTVLDATIFVVVLAGLSLLFYKRRLSSSLKVPLAKPGGILLGVFALSLLFNLHWLSFEHLLTSFLYLIRLGMYLSLPVLIWMFGSDEKRRLILSMLAGGFLTVVIGLVQYQYYPNLGNLFYLGWDDHLYRLFSVFLDPNFTSVFYVMIFLLLIGILVQQWEKAKHLSLVASLMALATLFGIILTFSRTGMIALVIGVVVLLVTLRMKKLLIGVLGIALVLVIGFSDVRIEGLNPFRTASSLARIESAQIATHIWLENPVFGVGYNTYRYAQNKYGYRVSGSWETSHADAGTDNSFLFVLATTGIAGLAAYSFFWFSFLKETLLIMRVQGSIISYVTFSSTVALLGSSLFLNTLFYPFLLVWIVVLFGVMVRR